MTGPKTLFERVADEALAAYGLEGAEYTFLRHNDAATFRVGAPDGALYLLRLHIPVSSALGTHGVDAVMIRSELLWLEALNGDTDLVLQRPMRNHAGELVTAVPIGAGEVYCSLLRWLPGEPYGQALESEATAHQIGRIFATLHRHAERWPMPSGFRRPARDGRYFEDVLWALRPAVEDGRIARDDYVALAKAMATLIERLGYLSRSPREHGILHGDGHKGNMLLDAGEVRLIDFSFCAFGNYMFDLGIVLSDMNPTYHAAFLEGYRAVRALPEGWSDLAEGFFIGAIVGTFSFWVPRPEAEVHLREYVPRIVREYVALYNRGEPFWPYA